MVKRIAFITFFLTFLFGTITYAHPGRTDSSGGHNCSEKSIAKGLCSGYHNHNGGDTSSGVGASTTAPATRNDDMDCSEFGSYDEVVEYWNSKGYSATNDPENLDGWGNGQVDDGIPCEAPSDYDRTKINNSPEQVQYNQDQQDIESGEKQGAAQGMKDGYQESESNSFASSGSDASKEGYATGYKKGYADGKKKIEAEKTIATKEGYTLGKKQDKIAVPGKYTSHTGLKKAYEDGFNKAVAERVGAKKKELTEQGYNDGKKDTHSPPKGSIEEYVTAYQEGYDNAQNELKEEYLQMGYKAAFTTLKYKEPDLTNSKFKGWYKEGFKSNKEIAEIIDAGLALGKKGTTLTIPAEYQKAKPIFTHYYNVGLKEYEEEQDANQTAATVGISGLTLSWLGRRLYVAKKMIG
ncbi:YHYH domain-containing protein [Peribacillus frigoritolerans]|uniref:YHYH domain-containing protein n=1 Tax=Peribacillus frigoritolerans TaxID=450367 RepID=UPI00227E1DC3|nr:YHYH domain-containing protein [Peribacillus frigoritolerans]MCY8938518.1 YHYH domain-containing protein [Peribacillus frigoritolerans]